MQTLTHLHSVYGHNEQTHLIQQVWQGLTHRQPSLRPCQETTSPLQQLDSAFLSRPSFSKRAFSRSASLSERAFSRSASFSRRAFSRSAFFFSACRFSCYFEYNKLHPLLLLMLLLSAHEHQFIRLRTSPTFASAVRANPLSHQDSARVVRNTIKYDNVRAR